MTILFSNNEETTLAGAITNIALTANLSPGSGANFPHPAGGDYFVGSFFDQATGLITEIVHVTDVTGDVITMVRGQEGTTAVAWAAGDAFGNFWTSGQAAAMLQNGQTPTQPARIITVSTVQTLLVSDYRIGLNRTVAPAAQVINLPNGAAIGQSFVIQDLAGNFAADPVTVTPPAGSIAGMNNFIMNENRQSATFTYFGTNLWGVDS